MNSRAILLTVCSALTLLSCEKRSQEGGVGTGRTVLPLTIEQKAAKTWIDSDVQGRQLPVYWSDGDIVFVNGQQSAPLEIAPGTKLSNAEFKLRSVSAPYSVIYPASIVSGEAFDAEGRISVNLPSSQQYDASTFACGSAILYGYGQDEGEPVWMQNLCAAVRVSLKGDTDDAISAAQMSSHTGLSGDFTLNPATGELERRRAELKQILKDAGYFNDPKPLERLGLRLISGRTHWKLQYANVRVTMSKTPSDYRANLNNGNEIANRCF